MVDVNSYGGCEMTCIILFGKIIYSARLYSRQDYITGKIILQ